MTKTAILLGSKGLIGNHVLHLLLTDNDYEKVKVFVRKPLLINHPKLEQYIVNFNDSNSFEKLVTGDVIFCCLGTTIKIAGSQDAFRKVDYKYPLTFAQAGKQNNVKQYLIISSMGATTSTSNFYLKTKGEVEAAIKNLNFYSFVILRPSMLLGDRKEFRLGEIIGKVVMQAISFLFIGSLKKYKAIQANTVAQAMIRQSKTATEGVTVLLSDKIQATGKMD
jgi:uncharacterized protein YbjT (DUF2867 family)